MKNKVAIIFLCSTILLTNFANAEELNTSNIFHETARQAAENPNEKPVERVEIDERDIEQLQDENILQESFVLKGIIIDSDIKEISRQSLGT